jgi:hypothetical protein
MESGKLSTLSDKGSIRLGAAQERQSVQHDTSYIRMSGCFARFAEGAEMNKQAELFERDSAGSERTYRKRRQSAADFREQVQAALDAYRTTEGQSVGEETQGRSFSSAQRLFDNRARVETQS